MTASGRTVVSVTQRFGVSEERVFDAWTQSKTLATWFALVNPAEQVVSIAADLRIGGSFSFVIMRNGQEVNHFGEYLAIDRPRRLVFTWMGKKDTPEVAIISIVIERQETGCLLTLSHDMPVKWSEMSARFEKSWQKMLAAIAATLA